MSISRLIGSRVVRLGWKPDLPDYRDLRLAAPDLRLQPLPSAFSLRSAQVEPPYDQGAIGSCVGNGVARAVQVERAKQKLDTRRPSRLFIYFWARYLEGDPSADNGCQIRDAVKVVAKYGAPPEADWGYDVSQFATQPPQSVEALGKLDRVLQYLRVPQSVYAIKVSLLAGYPVIFGFTAYDSFMSNATAQSGLVSMPGPADSVVGGHCMVFVGWDDHKQLPNGALGALEAANSWDVSWGDQGYCWMPYAYVSPGLSSDYWSIRWVQAPAPGAARGVPASAP